MITSGWRSNPGALLTNPLSLHDADDPVERNDHRHCCGQGIERTEPRAGVAFCLAELGSHAANVREVPVLQGHHSGDEDEMACADGRHVRPIVPLSHAPNPRPVRGSR